ncbi:hypothetical protein BH11ARM1_BH11ARM1_16680 [soil metagenome]
MDLRDALFHNPLPLLAGCAVWIPLAIWIISLVNWMIVGDIDAVFGIAGVFVAVGLGYVSIDPPTPTFAYYSFPAAMSTVILFPIFRHSLNQRGLRQVDVEDLERAHEALRQRGDNMVAKFQIAKILYELGYPGHALRIAETCLSSTSPSFFPEEVRMVKRWRWAQLKPSAFEPVRCSECGTSNEPGNVLCKQCHSAFLLNRVKGRLLPSTMGRKLLGAWVVMVAVITGIPWLASVGGPSAIVGIFALMILALGVLAFAFLPRSGGQF